MTYTVFFVTYLGLGCIRKLSLYVVCLESVWLVATVQDHNVLGLAEQLSSISTQDMDSTDNSFSMDPNEELSETFVTSAQSNNSLLSVDVSPPLPCTPNTSPSLMQYGGAQQCVLCPRDSSLYTADRLQADEGIGDDDNS